MWDLPFFCLLLNCWNVPMTTDLIYPWGHFQRGYSFVDSGALLNRKGFTVEHQFDSLWFFPSHIRITYLWLYNKLPPKTIFKSRYYLTVSEGKKISCNLVGCLVPHEVVVELSMMATVICLPHSTSFQQNEESKEEKLREPR